MRKTFLIIALLMFTVLLGFGSPGFRTYDNADVVVTSFDSLANSAAITLGGNYTNYTWELKWKALVAGTPASTPVACNSTCAYALQGSLDGSTWTTLKSTDATTGGVTYVSGMTVNYVRFVPAITPTTTAIATVTFKAQ